MLSAPRTIQFVLFALLSSFFINTQVYALPFRARRQDGSQTFTTVTTKMTDKGPATETCTIVLTPVTDNNGQSAVQEVKTCTVQLNAGTVPPTTSGISTTAASVSITSASSVVSSTDTAQSSVITASISSAASDAATSSISSPGPTDSASSSGTVAPNSISTVSSGSPGSTVASSVSSASGIVPPVSTSPISSVTSTSGSPVSTGVSGTESTASQPVSTSAASPEAANTASPSSTVSTTSATAAAADSSDTGFTLPGKKLSVLPIGLGVFAGISVIALIVVGLVTYERTKYRKAFRQRKLAESGAAMGYGGMTQAFTLQVLSYLFALSVSFLNCQYHLENWWEEAQKYGPKAGQVVLNAVVKWYQETAHLVSNLKIAMDDTVQEVRNVRVELETFIAEKDITMDHVSEVLSEEIGKAYKELKDDITVPLPENPSEKAKRRSELIEEALRKVDRAYVQAMVRLGIPDEQADQQFQAVLPKIHNVLLVAGNIIDHHPFLLDSVIFGVSMLLLPEVQILRPIMALFGFGPLGPVKGSTAAWLQSRFWGGFVKAGSWFAILQKVGMTLTGSWIQRVMASAGLAAVLGFVVNKTAKLCS
ncbi:hypothetical protein AN958_11450 [Leucoagaricus sp. SymC.cos]|nr:hypothetical protein AN958_11450 [Leucoagaricus sp. SymC.cos]